MGHDYSTSQDTITCHDISDLSQSSIQSPSPTPFAPSSLTSTNSRRKHRRQQSSLIIVNNGITGKTISSRICKIAALFWRSNVETLSYSEQLEVGMSIFFGMLSANGEMKNVQRTNFNQSKVIEKTSMRYLDMLGWLIRNLTTDNIDLASKLCKLGELHKTMGIETKHFRPMLESMHETFAYYFESKYSIEVKYAIDEIFVFAAKIMTGKDLKCNVRFGVGNVPFLRNLETCLKSDIGSEYLYRFLSQTFCDEIVIFLRSLSRFKNAMCDKERFFIAREITETSIDQKATFSLNLSYETRGNAMFRMGEKEHRFEQKKELNISSDFLDAIEVEVYRLIIQNHWAHFVNQMQTLQRKSSTMN